jgi:hypothetical protein
MRSDKLKAMVTNQDWQDCAARLKSESTVDALHGLFDLIIDRLAGRLDEIKVADGRTISFMAEGREILTINVTRKDLRIYIHPPAKALFPPKMHPRVERFRFWDGSYQKTSGMYRGMSFWISDPRYLPGAGEIIDHIPTGRQQSPRRGDRRKRSPQ